MRRFHITPSFEDDIDRDVSPSYYSNSQQGSSGNEVRIDRQKILETTEIQLWNLRKEKKLKKKSYVIFENEFGSDAGGLLAEWCTEYFKEATNPLNGIFRHHGKEMRLTVFGDDHGQDKCRKSPIQSQQKQSLPLIKNQDELSDEELKDYLPWWTAGVMIGKVLLLQKVSTSCRLDYSIWRQLLGQSPCIEDLGEEEQEVAQRMRNMLDDPEYCKQIDLSFEISIEEEDGQNIQVNSMNQSEYINLYAKRKIFGSDKSIKQRSALFQGFRESLPYEYLFSDHILILQDDARENDINDQQQSNSKYKEIITPTQLTPKELDDIICGSQEIDVSEWERFCHYDGIKGQQSEQQSQWIWNIIRRMNDKQRRDLLQFSTGVRNLPIGGFARLPLNSDGYVFEIKWVSCNVKINDEIIQLFSVKQNRESISEYKKRIDEYINALKAEANIHECAIRALNENKIKNAEQMLMFNIYKRNIELIKKDIEECEIENNQYEINMNSNLIVDFDSLIQQRTHLNRGLTKFSSQNANEIQKLANEAELKAFANEKIAYIADIKTTTIQNRSNQPLIELNIQRINSRKSRQRLQQTLQITKLIHSVTCEIEKKSNQALINVEQYDDDLEQAHLMELNELEEKLLIEIRLNDQLKSEINKQQIEQLEEESLRFPLPKGHTCFNSIDIPLYQLEEIMEMRILYALNNTDNGFGFN
ncbi:MAG: hypothetical protein EZS28_002851 [Streblomastix strix]|uniref:HECT-type E3 ubiquitin transferase n=1 Tax=Streblomastix strix TaxID=222440 RepID=A0A5J4X2Z4_9EUKA|nr:MAG: hypothetical protein EZS28_002851 [Streblomastix strix]